MKNTALIKEQQQQIAQLTEQVSQLTQQLDWFKRQLFGRKSEKHVLDNPYQNALFIKAALADTSRGDSTRPTTEVKAHKRTSKKQHHQDDVNDTGLRFSDDTPQRIIDVPAPELEGDDADDYEIIDYKETVRLAQQHASYVVLRYRRPVVRHKASQTLNTAAAPDNVLEGSYADVSVLAGLMVDKAVYHLPLYRQHQRMLDAGIKVSRTTLINWMHKGIELLEPVYQAQWRHVLQSQMLAMDEVPIKAGRKNKGKMQQTCFWPIYGEEDEVVFTWSRSRGTQHAIDQLNGFNGTLLTDGYPVYDRAVAQLNKAEADIVHANCWAHARRYFEKSLAVEPDLAQQALAQIGELYAVEKQTRQQCERTGKTLTAETILSARQQYSEPIVTGFFQWVEELRQNPALLPSNPMSQALVYVCERIRSLKVFLGNPHVPLDTNHLERALRVIPMGRKNYLFCWSELGAEQLGMLQSLMVTCRLQGINPYTYLVDVLQRIGRHPASRVDELTPRVWKDKFGENFLTSDLGKMGSSQY